MANKLGTRHRNDSLKSRSSPVHEVIDQYRDNRQYPDRKAVVAKTDGIIISSSPQLSNSLPALMLLMTACSRGTSSRSPCRTFLW